jgi:DNA-binding Lrp family transcriptional regulator
MDFDRIDKDLIPKLCGDIGDEMFPFREMAESLSISEETLLGRIKDFLRRGLMRRFGAILFHRKAGFAGNAMIVMNVPDGILDEMGEKISAYSAVSHCYARPRLPDWPYNLYAMIHDKTEDECRKSAARLMKKIGAGDYRILSSVREFKKSSMVYLRETNNRNSHFGSVI